MDHACQASLSITNSGVCSNSCPLSWWCHPAISSSVVPFSSCPQSLPALGSFQMSQLFTSGGQRIGVSASASVLPVSIQDWFPLGWTVWISLKSKGLSRVFFNICMPTTNRLIRYRGIQSSGLQSSSHSPVWETKSDPGQPQSSVLKLPLQLDGILLHHCVDHGAQEAEPRQLQTTM